MNAVVHTSPLSPAPPLSAEAIQAFGDELDALRQRVRDDLGADDVAHIRRIMRLQHRTEALGRLLLHLGIDPLTFVVGTASLGVSKILENMEIGHNIMHGQYDWTGDPELASHRYEWDVACDGDQWRDYHNYEHHTFTNVLGKDRDIGYGFLRITPEQAWEPRHLAQPLVATWLALNFQWGVGIHPLHLEDLRPGGQSLATFRARATPFLRKAGWQLFKDYVFFPALALGNAPRVAFGNFLANGTRNLWTFSIIFCGHFPEGVEVFEDTGMQHESRGAWYLRQIRGSANIEGSSAFHVMSGHLSHQIEHHLFPDIPASRYPEMAPVVEEICERYGLPYNTGSFRQQMGSVIRQILRLSLPTRRTEGGKVPKPARGAAAVAA